jgi:hypothetical protein
MKFARIGSNIINLEQIAYLEIVSERVGIQFVGVVEKLSLFGGEAAALIKLIGAEDKVPPKDKALNQFVAGIRRDN